MCVNQSYVWYVGYGSNLCEKRFLCYIKGGKFNWGGSDAKGCSDKSLPIVNKQIYIPYGLYFAKCSTNWDNGGIAFINPNKELDESNQTLGRMWKITKEQYEQIRDQERRSWYNHEIQLGKEDNFPIYTITSDTILTQYNQPSEGYIKTIALGLKETGNWNNEKIFQYLKEKAGIKSQIDKDKLFKIIKSATSSNNGYAATACKAPSPKSSPSTSSGSDFA
jgi:hypothetical protein